MRPWPTRRLGELTDVLSGFAFDSKEFSDSDGLPLVRIRDVIPGTTTTYFKGSFDPRYLVGSGEILIGMDGEFNRARWRGGKALLNQRVSRIASSCRDLDDSYLFHFLPAALKAIERVTPFVTVKHLSVKQVRDIEIPLPPLPEQRRIAEILDKADALRAKRRAAIVQLDALTQSIFFDMFGDVATNPKGWLIQPLQEVVKEGTIVTYGMVQAGEEFAGGVPYIRTGDIVDGEIITAGLRHTHPAIAAKFSRSRVEAGDIVMSIRATVGTTALVPPELDGANLTQGTGRISPGKQTDGPYLLYHLRAPGTQHWISLQIKGATFREITLARLRELPVAVPPIGLQHEFARCVAMVEKLKATYRTTMAELDSLFASLHHRAFRGEL
jgi:type I restriction enzyme S subunit